MIFVTFGFAFLTATFFSEHFSWLSLFLFLFLRFHAATKRVLPSPPLDIYQKLDNNTTICSDKRAGVGNIKLNNLFYVEV